MKSVYTTCRYCESNCALEVIVDEANNKVEKIRADKNNSHTWQDACSKGLTAYEMAEHPLRITSPMKRIPKGDSFEYIEVSYEQAISEIAAQLNQIRNDNGADAIAGYLGNPIGFGAGVSMTSGFFEAIGTQNLYSASSIDQNNNHAVTKAMFGQTFLPLSPDIEHCDFVLLIGTNPAESKFGWLGYVSNGWEKTRTAMKERGTKVIVIDPRKTKSARQASQHIPIIPGTDWAFLLGLLKVIFEANLTDQKSLEKLDHSQVNALQALCTSTSLTYLSGVCGIKESLIQHTAKEYAASNNAMCMTQTGVSMHDTGTLGHWLGLVIDVITGNFDTQGSRFWQPGYINMTKLINEGDKEDTFSRVRKLKTIINNRAISELPDEINTPGEGQVKALIMQCGNPVVSGPDGKALDEAIEKLDLVIAVDLVQRESHRHAHWLIPGEHWLERGELNYLLNGGSNQPFVQYAQQAIQAPNNILPEWKFFVDLTLAMKVPFLGKRGVNTMIRLTRLLAEKFNKPSWEFSPDLLVKLMLLMDKKVTWKALQDNPHGIQFEEKKYGQLKEQMGKLKTQIAPAEFVEELDKRIHQKAENNTDYPFLMFGKRDLNMMNSWLMDVPNKQKREDNNDCEIHADDAERLGITDGQRIKVSSAIDSIELSSKITRDIRPGTICIQHGWGSRSFNPKQPQEQAKALGVNKNLLISNTEIDPFSSTPKLNSTRVNIAPV